MRQETEVLNEESSVFVSTSVFVKGGDFISNHTHDRDQEWPQVLSLFRSQDGLPDLFELFRSECRHGIGDDGGRVGDYRGSGSIAVGWGMVWAGDQIDDDGG